MKKSETNNRPSIFLSYSRQEKEIAQSMCDLLINNNIQVWMDTEDLEALDNWEDEIKKAIISNDCIIFLASCNSIKKGCYSYNELKIAKENNKKIIPVIIDNNFTSFPNDFSELNEYTWIDLKPFLNCDEKEVFLSTGNKKFKNILDQLIRTIFIDIEWKKVHSEIVAKTLEWENHQKDNSYLLIDNELTFYINSESENRGKEPRLTKEAIEYLKESNQKQTERNERQRRINRRQKIMLNILCMLVFILIFAINLIWGQYKKNLSENLVNESRALKNEPDTALLLSLQANQLSNDPDVKSSLITTIIENQNVVLIIQIPTPITK